MIPTTAGYINVHKSQYTASEESCARCRYEGRGGRVRRGHLAERLKEL